MLVLRCREGDAAALDALLGRWQERLWRHALRLTGDPEAAWDVLQEALLVIAQQIRRLEAESAFAVWAYRVTTHKARDWLRQHVRRKERERRYAEMRGRAEVETDDPPIRQADLRSAMRNMPPADQALLKLCYEDEFTMDEIAQMLALPPGTVKSRLYSARHRLRDLMENNHEHD